MPRPEFELIDWIRARVTDRPPVLLGIGDDAACLQAPHRGESLVTIDMVMEGTDFTFPPATPELVGRKSLAVNLSDIAAMAGRPTAAFVSTALPNSRGPQFARDLHAGIIQLADEYGVVIAGGDTNSWNGPLVISIAVIGEPFGLAPVRRSGAKPGDWLFVTGEVGGSLPSHRHLTFTPRIAEAEKLARSVSLHAMLDISDGLAADLYHILNASQVGAMVEAAHVPLSAAARSAADGRSPLFHGLGDGEDFELLFTVSPADGQRLVSSWRESTPVTKIGEITHERGARLRLPDGTIEPLAAMGWTHQLGADNDER